jgi:hypothetical protein
VARYTYIATFGDDRKTTCHIVDIGTRLSRLPAYQAALATMVCVNK